MASLCNVLVNSFLLHTLLIHWHNNTTFSHSIFVMNEVLYRVHLKPIYNLDYSPSPLFIVSGVNCIVKLCSGIDCKLNIANNKTWGGTDQFDFPILRSYYSLCGL